MVAIDVNDRLCIVRTSDLQRREQEEKCIDWPESFHQPIMIGFQFFSPATSPLQEACRLIGRMSLTPSSSQDPPSAPTDHPSFYHPPNDLKKGYIVIDGRNVCLTYREARENPEALHRGLQIAFEYFNKLGWPRNGIIAVLPDEPQWKSDSFQAITPLGNIRWISLHKTEDDDMFAISFARELKALLVSNDKFRDHVTRWHHKFGPREASQLREWCAARVLNFTFHRDSFFPNLEMITLALTELRGQPDVFRCSTCGTPIASSEDIIASRDTAGVFGMERRENPAGSSFSLLKTKSVLPGATQEHWFDCALSDLIRQESIPRLQDTWFPDYAWSLLFCANPECESTKELVLPVGDKFAILRPAQSLGWKFRLVRDESKEQPLFDLLLPEFYGLIHERVINGRFAAVGARLETFEPPPEPRPVEQPFQTRGRRRGSRGRGQQHARGQGARGRGHERGGNRRH